MAERAAGPPRVVAVDLHGVLLSGLVNDQAAYATRVGLDQSTWLRVRREVLDVEDGWSRLERGEWTLAEFSARLARAVTEAGGRCDDATAAEIWGAPHPFHGSVPRLRLVDELNRLRAGGLTVVLVTNNIADWRDAWRSALPEHAAFDVEFDSSHVGARKPEPRFWEIVEERTGAAPDEIVLVDDRAEMVAAAEARGWRGVLFTTEEECVAALAAVVRYSPPQ